MPVSDCHLRLLCADDLPLILSWRNHPNVRRWMYTNHEISLQEHLQWYSRTSKDDTRSLLILECNQRAKGFVSLHKITDWGLGEWGFYVDPNAVRGTGRALGVAAIQYAFEKLRLRKLCGEVISANNPSIHFHASLGFQCEGILREHYFDGKNYWDVHYFGLLAAEWRTSYSRHYL